MKIRSDFVTNSSSSSFVVVFGSKSDYDNMAETMRRNFATSEEIEYVVTDISNNKYSREEVLDMLREYEESNVEYEFGWKIHSWSETRQLLENPEFRKKLSDEVKARMENYKKRLPKRCYYCSVVTYGDDDGDFFGNLEHKIMPRMPFVFKRIDNH